MNTSKITVASTNPVKLKATEIGFKRMFGEDLEVSGVSAKSEVSDQPMTEDETLKGATNRALNARKMYPDSDYWVGLEGGVHDYGTEIRSFAWIVILDKNGKIGKGKTATFVLPEKVSDLIRDGKELGDADDIVFGSTNSKQKNGAIGILTGDVLTRAGFYSDAVIMALIPFKNPTLY